MRLHFATGMVVATALLGTGCAHSTLRLELDVYRGDPVRDLVLTPDQLSQIRSQLRQASQKVSRDLERQIQLAKDLFGVFEQYFCLDAELYGSPCDRSALDLMRTHLALHEQKVRERGGGIQMQLDASNDALTTYQSELVPASVLRDTSERSPIPRPGVGDTQDEDRGNRLALSGALLRARLREAVDSVRAFAQGTESDLTRDLHGRWAMVLESLQRNPALSNATTDPKYKDRLNAMRGQVQDLASELKGPAPELARDLEATLAVNTGVGGLTRALALIGRQANTLPEMISSSGDIVAELGSLSIARTLFDSQIDKLKDPADPVWRIISAPENESFWNQVFTRTWFYAEGKSEVIVVRDGPLDYRVQSASNNPAALVQGQLQISRAVADAAITVIGASIGEKVMGPSGSTSGTTATGLPESGTVEDLARRQVKAELVEQQRRSAIQRLRDELHLIVAALQAAKTPGDRTPMLHRLEAVASAYKDIFVSIQQEPDNGTKESPQAGGT